MPFDGTHLEEWRITLLKAAEIVRERGLARFTQEDDCGHVCFHGAVNLALGVGVYGGAGHHIMLEVNRRTRALLKQRGWDDGQEPQVGVASWNNMPGRTAEEVASVMESVATQGRE